MNNNTTTPENPEVCTASKEVVSAAEALSKAIIDFINSPDLQSMVGIAVAHGFTHKLPDPNPALKRTDEALKAWYKAQEVKKPCSCQNPAEAGIVEDGVKE